MTIFKFILLYLKLDLNYSLFECLNYSLLKHEKNFQSILIAQYLSLSTHLYNIVEYFLLVEESYKINIQFNFELSTLYRIYLLHKLQIRKNILTNFDGLSLL